jgi:hypothetical protein
VSRKGRVREHGEQGVGKRMTGGVSARTALLKPLVRAGSGSRESRVAMSWFCHTFPKLSALVCLLEKTQYVEDV